MLKLHFCLRLWTFGKYPMVFEEDAYLTLVGCTVPYLSFVNLVQICVLTDGVCAFSISYWEGCVRVSDHDMDLSVSYFISASFSFIYFEVMFLEPKYKFRHYIFPLGLLFIIINCPYLYLSNNTLCLKVCFVLQ